MTGKHDDREPHADHPSLAESAAAWVPPWARNVPDLVVEPAADNPPDHLAFHTGPTTHDQSPADGGQPRPAEPDWLAAPVPVARGMKPAANGGRAADLLDRDDRAEVELTDHQLRGALEAILLVIDEPASDMLLASVLQQPTDRINEALAALAEDYTAGGRGFELRRAAGGWRLYTRADYADFVERFVLDGQQVRLTQAALETLAVVAYKQPVTRSRISAIRGVNCDGVIKTLIGRGLVEECGTEPGSGAHLYQTTPLFLEKVGIDSVAELPPLAPFLPDNVDEIDGATR
jgi:segregation and condensation protein B